MTTELPVRRSTPKDWQDFAEVIGINKVSALPMRNKESTPSEPPIGFLTLPGELRNEIYSMIFPIRLSPWPNATGQSNKISGSHSPNDWKFPDKYSVGWETLRALTRGTDRSDWGRRWNGGWYDARYEVAYVLRRCALLRGVSKQIKSEVDGFVASFITCDMNVMVRRCNLDYFDSHFLATFLTQLTLHCSLPDRVPSMTRMSKMVRLEVLRIFLRSKKGRHPPVVEQATRAAEILLPAFAQFYGKEDTAFHLLELRVPVQSRKMFMDGLEQSLQRTGIPMVPFRFTVVDWNTPSDIDDVWYQTFTAADWNTSIDNDDVWFQLLPQGCPSHVQPHREQE